MARRIRREADVERAVETISERWPPREEAAEVPARVWSEFVPAPEVKLEPRARTAPCFGCGTMLRFELSDEVVGMIRRLVPTEPHACPEMDAILANYVTNVGRS